MSQFYSVPKRLSDDIDIKFPSNTIAGLILNDLFVEGLSLEAFIRKHTAYAEESSPNFIPDWQEGYRYKLTRCFQSSDIWMVVAVKHCLHDYQVILESPYKLQYYTIATYCDRHPKFRKITHQPNYRVFKYMISSAAWVELRQIFIVLETTGHLFKLTLTLNL